MDIWSDIVILVAGIPTPIALGLGALGGVGTFAATWSLCRGLQ